jgi:hypothetical protein
LLYLTLREYTYWHQIDFYLKQNDVIYVQPDKTKAAILDQDKLRFYSLLTTGVTLLAALIYLFKK